MILVGIDVAKNKHDCLIINSNGEVLANSFTIPNSMDGFLNLYSKICSYSINDPEIKIGLEATGHYSNNIAEFFLNKNFPIFIMNPLHTNLYRKSQSFRKTKTDKLDTLTICSILQTQKLTPYASVSYHSQELKSLTRYRFRLVDECSKLKVSFSRLMTIIFPELEPIVKNLQVNSVYHLMKECPSAEAVVKCHLTHLTNLLIKNSKGHYRKEMAITIRNAAKTSIGTCTPMKSLELVQTIERILLLRNQISLIEAKIEEIMKQIDSPMTTIPGISTQTAAVIYAEIGDFSKFSSAEKILAFAGMEPSVYQSGEYNSTHGRMVKRGSKYLRHMLFLAAENVSHWDPSFANYLARKRSEGKHYNVAISHVVRKLLRTIYAMESKHQAYQP
ncbi:MAG: IS110 family transposase [Eubacteriales bacterium]|nr:IS110 family transposase [Eubacteriales bacterium]